LDADIVAVSKVDAVSPEEARRAAEAARQVIPGAEFIAVSAVTGEGLPALVTKIAGGARHAA
jgi:Ni2+-binding GTPase involved in maturation of urease and hydrogenase